MKTLRFTCGALCALAAVSGSVASAADYSPKRGRFDESTGYMEAEFAGDGWYRGSAVVARNSKLLYSCGHLFYENGVWADRTLFYRNYNGRESPEISTGVAPRGFRYFSDYSANADAYGPDASRSFAYDFTVFYGTKSFGPAVDYWKDGGTALKSGRTKQIVGYPAEVDATGEPGYYYQHGTKWFPTKARQVRGDYYALNHVSTGGGNSGGPVFVTTGGGDEYSLAGILVAGSTDSAGVYALNASSNGMATAALGLKSITKTFGTARPLTLPDAGTTYLTRSTVVSGFTEEVTALRFSMLLTTPRRGDVDIYLRSPSGRIKWINKHSKNTASDVVVTEANYTSTFRGLAANGTWQLKMRDAVKGERAKFNRFSLTVSALGK